MMDLPVMVVDNGSETIKAGFSHGTERTKGEDIDGSSSPSPLLSPQVSFPCLIGTPRLPAIPIENKRYFGDELTSNITLLRTSRFPLLFLPSSWILKQERQPIFGRGLLSLFLSFSFPFLSFPFPFLFLSPFPPFIHFTFFFLFLQVTKREVITSFSLIWRRDN